MGITRTTMRKRSHTGAMRAQFRKKRKFEMGRQPSNTKIGEKRIHPVRVRGGNIKHRALRLETGNFSWGTEGVSRKTRVIQVVYHPSNNELVRTNTLTKAAIVQIDAHPFRQYFESHYGVPASRRGKVSEDIKQTSKTKARLHQAKLTQGLEPQFAAGRIYAAVSSRPGQSGRVDGYILEGEELQFYLRKLTAQKK